MDDGGKLDYNKGSKNKAIVLNTQSFTESEVFLLKEELSNKFHLDCEIRNNKNKKIIVINSYSKFMELTFEHIMPEMRYKLP